LEAVASVHQIGWLAQVISGFPGGISDNVPPPEKVRPERRTPPRLALCSGASAISQKTEEINMKKLITIAILALGFFNVASSYAIDGPIPQCFPCTKW